jgi:hypothetical protein
MEHARARRLRLRTAERPREIRFFVQIKFPPPY